MKYIVVKKDEFEKYKEDSDRLKTIVDDVNKIDSSGMNGILRHDMSIIKTSLFGELSRKIYEAQADTEKMEEQLKTVEAERDWYKLKYGELLCKTT